MKSYLASIVVVCCAPACYWDRTSPVRLADRAGARASLGADSGSRDSALDADAGSVVDGVLNEDASLCDGDTCRGCEVGECGRKICDVRSGLCVECNPNNRSACAVDRRGRRDVCNADTNTCETGVKEGSAPLCGSSVPRACVSDDECPNGSTCVQEALEGEITGSWYCMPKLGSALCLRPFAGTETRTTRDGATATVCTLLTSTCSAHSDQRDGKNCESELRPGSGDDTSCGVAGMPDGYCLHSEIQGFRCTVPCTDSEDCPLRYGFKRPQCVSQDRQTDWTGVCIP